MPVGSKLRKRLLRRGLAAAFAAVNRSDVEPILAAYEPEVEIWTTGMDATGIRDCYRGHDGIREMFAELDGVFSEWGWSVDAVVDGGDRLAVRLKLDTQGRASGAATAITNAGSAYFLSPRGRVARQNFYVQAGGWEMALEATGLSE